MTRPTGLLARAGLALVASQLTVLAAAALGGGLLVAAPAALLAVIVAGVWWQRGDARLMYGAALAGALALLAPLEQPLDPLDRGLALAGALGLVGFVEYGSLAHRVETLDVGDDQSVLNAMRARLTRVLAWTAFGTVVVVGLTAVPGPWFSDAFAQSIERGGPAGVLLVGGALAALVSALARFRQHLAERQAGSVESGEPGTSDS